jgi:hypothetical protein
VRVRQIEVDQAVGLDDGHASHRVVLRHVGLPEDGVDMADHPLAPRLVGRRPASGPSPVVGRRVRRPHHGLVFVGRAIRPAEEVPDLHVRVDTEAAVPFGVEVDGAHLARLIGHLTERLTGLEEGLEAGEDPVPARLGQRPGLREPAEVGVRQAQATEVTDGLDLPCDPARRFDRGLSVGQERERHDQAARPLELHDLAGDHLPVVRPVLVRCADLPG